MNSTSLTPFTSPVFLSLPGEEVNGSESVEVSVGTAAMLEGGCYGLSLFAADTEYAGF